MQKHYTIYDYHGLGISDAPAKFVSDYNQELQFAAGNVPLQNHPRLWVNGPRRKNIRNNQGTLSVSTGKKALLPGGHPKKSILIPGYARPGDADEGTTLSDTKCVALVFASGNSFFPCLKNLIHVSATATLLQSHVPDPRDPRRGARDLTRVLMPRIQVSRVGATRSLFLLLRALPHLPTR